MTYQSDSTLPSDLLEQIASQGLDFLPELIRILVNAAMRGERQQYLGIGPYQHSKERQGYANVTSRKLLKPGLERSPLRSPRYAKAVSIQAHWRKGCAVNER